MWATPAMATNQNEITQTCELNNSRKRRHGRAAYMRQYRITNTSPEKKTERNEYQRNYKTKKIISREKSKTQRVPEKLYDSFETFCYCSLGHSNIVDNFQ